MTAVCPCCQRELPGRLAIPEIRRYLHMSKHERAAFDLLALHFAGDVQTSRLVDHVYSDDPDGGPDYAAGVVSVVIFTLRKKLRPFGLTVKGYGGGRSGGGFTRMFWLPPELQEAA